MADPQPTGKITRDDIEAKLRQIKGEVDSTTDTAKPYAIAAGAVLVVAVVGLAYFFGKRKGKKTTVVEVRRV
jgi:hypothetical protein